MAEPTSPDFITTLALKQFFYFDRNGFYCQSRQFELLHATPGLSMSDTDAVYPSGKRVGISSKSIVGEAAYIDVLDDDTLTVRMRGRLGLDVPSRVLQKIVGPSFTHAVFNHSALAGRHFREQAAQDIVDLRTVFSVLGQDVSGPDCDFRFAINVPELDILIEDWQQMKLDFTIGGRTAIEPYAMDWDF